jgi:hypothetical protein
VEEKVVPQNVSVERKKEGVTGAFEALEKVGLAEAHEAATGAGEVVDDLEVGGGESGRGRGLEMTAKAVTRKVERLDDSKHVRPEEVGARIVRGIGIARKGDSEGLPNREVGANAVGDSEEFTAVALVGLGVVLDNERAGAPDKEEAHDLSPVVGLLAFLECGEGGKRDVRVFEAEIGLAYEAEHGLGSDAKVGLFGEEKSELIREIKVSFVVGRRGEENDLAVVSLQVVTDRLIDTALAVTEIMRLVDDDEAVTRELA